MFDITRKLRKNGKEYSIEPLADLVIRFIESGDESLLATLQQPLMRIETLCRPNVFDEWEWTWTEKEQRMVELSLYLIRTKPAAHTWRQHYHGEYILRSSADIKYHREANGYDRTCRQFIDGLQAAGYPEEMIRRFVMPYQHGCHWKGWFVSTSETEPVWKTDFERYVWDMSDGAIAEIGPGQQMPWGLAVALAKHRQPALRAWLQRWRANATEGSSHGIKFLEDLLGISDAFDEEIIAIMLAEGDRYYLWTAERMRPGVYLEQMHGLAVKSVPEGIGLHWLTKHDPSLAVKMAAELIGTQEPKKTVDVVHLQELHQLCAERLDEGGREFFEKLLSPDYENLLHSALGHLVEFAPPEAESYVVGYKERVIELTGGKNIHRVWKALAEKPHLLTPHLDDIKKALRDKEVGEHTKDLLQVVLGEEGYYFHLRDLMLSADKDERSLGVTLAGNDYRKKAGPALLEVLPAASPKAWRDRILKALEKQGVDITAYQDPKKVKPAAPVDDIVPAKLRKPAIKWLDVKSLPLLKRKDGTTMSEAAGWFLLDAWRGSFPDSSGIQRLLDVLDPGGNGTFAMQVLEGFIASDQKASGSWALVVAGHTGDATVIARLVTLIGEWCAKSRYQMAEAAVHAIARVPGDACLMTLDSLANRYRTKYKSVGKAAAEAFAKAAKSRGMTEDDLADVVVPDLGFDPEGLRRFDWKGGAALAGLGPDLKLSWSDATTGKSLKALPSTAPDDIKAEAKALAKDLKETAKAQTHRLETLLVQQRRWPVARWLGLFGNHPLLRSLAFSPVWGIYPQNGGPLRTFRRYPNGILADFNGAPEELEETDVTIGIVHPLELDDETIENWRAHLTRLKITQPFPQIDRPVERLDPLAANRRKIPMPEKTEITAAAFRTRAEKRGWQRGSVIEGGQVSSYFKSFPTAGVEAIVPTGRLQVTGDPLQPILVGQACFVKAGSVRRGSYQRDEPKETDERVLTLGSVPPIAYSEALADLKAIISNNS
ncbi:MAG: DUF4132 domain-containing protein [Verrucomicrobiaceae bacterium]|nr:MAG: DUF4132 domain-containing protein [Verrucomicrobiaceae bacterium]